MKWQSCIGLGLLTAVALFCGCSRGGDKDEDQKGGAPKPAAGAGGGGSLTLDAASQKRAGVEVQTLARAQWLPRAKVYGRVLDPAVLAGVAGEFAAARAALEASQAEWKRTAGLAEQKNASEKALQSAAATAARDRTEFEAAKLKLQAAFGSGAADRSDLPSLVESLATMRSALVRLDIPPGARVPPNPSRARVEVLSGGAYDAAFLAEAPAVDPQTQSRVLLFLVESNMPALQSGMAVTGYVEGEGVPEPGFVLPDSAVVRYEGEAWVYMAGGANGTEFARRRVWLDRPQGNGWFVSGGFSEGDRVAVTGVQMLLSEELNRSGFMSGERD